MKNAEIKQTNFVIGAGAGQGDYKVGLGQENTWDIGDRFNAPEHWQVKAVWYEVVDAIQEYPRFRRINLVPRGNDVDLNVCGGSENAQIQIAAFALYDAM